MYGHWRGHHRCCHSVVRRHCKGSVTPWCLRSREWKKWQHLLRRLLLLWVLLWLLKLLLLHLLALLLVLLLMLLVLMLLLH